MNIIQLVRKITYMIQNGNYMAGHAIFKGRKDSENTPEKILQEGLIIQDTSIGLSFTSRKFEPEYKECLANLTDLSANSNRAVIIISIPQELLSDYDSKHFSSCDNSSIVLDLTNEESKDYKDIYGNPTKIALLPSIYILGYFDVQKNIFIENPNYAFDTYHKEINISKLKPFLDKKYSQITEIDKNNLTKKL